MTEKQPSAHIERQSPEPEQMVAELEAAGWKKVMSYVWRAPNGALYRGPALAWRVMRALPQACPPLADELVAEQGGAVSLSAQRQYQPGWVPSCRCQRDCRCSCHRTGAKHIVPCCGPGTPQHKGCGPKKSTPRERQ